MREGHVVTEYHVPVLKEEVLEFLVTVPDGVYVDGTLGGGGHAEGILEKISPGGMLVGIDADAEAFEAAKARLQRSESKFTYVHDNSSNIRAILRGLNIPTINGLLLDLGVSSHQLDEASRGFSFRGDDRLDMRMDSRQSLDASAVVQTYTEDRLAEIFRTFGEERNSRRIARDIVEQRQAQKIETTGRLAAIIGKRVREPFLTKTLARIFQALRIEVNNELATLPRTLRDATDLLATGGRIVVISYHSLEDRIVKNFFQEQSATRIPSGHKLVPDRPVSPHLRVLTKKPIVASKEEQASNPRSRSAKMRGAEKL